ncbi:hypothetical protein MASR1M107_02930 [Ignavibacteriales bacterium]
MSYFTERQLRLYITDSFTKSAEQTMIKEASQTRNTIFLSFSHKDLDLAVGLKNYLASLKLDLYLDLFDSDLSIHTNRDTARRIKNRIKNLNYFFLLLSNNSVLSRWVPWELGIADGNKGVDKIFIVPVEDSSGESYGNEYLQIYKRIEIATNREVGMFEPNKSEGISISDFLKENML